MVTIKSNRQLFMTILDESVTGKAKTHNRQIIMNKYENIQIKTTQFSYR